MKFKKIDNLQYLNELSGYITEQGAVIIRCKSQYDWSNDKFWKGFKSLYDYHQGNSICVYNNRKEVLNHLRIFSLFP